MKKQLILFIVSLIIIHKAAVSATPDWEWSKSVYGGFSKAEYANGTCVSKAGNVYVTGFFENNPTIFGSDTLKAKGSKDIFVTKYNSSGDVIWSKSAGGKLADWGEKICVDESQNVYVIGNFASDTLIFGTHTLIKNIGVFKQSVFIAKYDSAGNFIWARSSAGNDDDAVSDFAIDNSGNLLLTGGFGSDTISFGSHDLFNNSKEDAFIVKYDNSGSVLWAKSFGGPEFESGYSICHDALNNVYVAANFSSDSLVIGTTTIKNHPSTNQFTKYNEILTVKYDSSGSFVWARQAGGSNNDINVGIASDSDNNIYIAGQFYSLSLTISTFTLTQSTMSVEAFIAKYDSAGNLIWAKTGGGSGGTEFISEIECNSDNLYIIGNFYGTVNFGTNTLTTSGGYGNVDVFILKYSSAGTVDWAKSAGGTEEEQSRGLSVDNSGNVYVVGYYTSDSISFGSSKLINSGSYDMFFSKLGSSSGTAILEANSTSELAVFPNPSEGNVNISYTAVNDGYFALKIIDLRGELLYSDYRNNNQKGSNYITNIDLSGFPKGIYLLNLISDQTTITKRIVIE